MTQPITTGTSQIKQGTVLIAIDPCVMQTTGQTSLTIGKEYKVVSVGNIEYDAALCCFADDTQFEVIDDAGDLHIFDIYDYEKYFKIKPSL